MCGSKFSYDLNHCIKSACKTTNERSLARGFMTNLKKACAGTGPVIETEERFVNEASSSAYQLINVDLYRIHF